ncbi:hypothetical protein [Mycobacterium asiaticum]|nr:hypothetical protein [Mycobacterium asiaticum]
MGNIVQAVAAGDDTRRDEVCDLILRSIDVLVDLRIGPLLPRYEQRVSYR